ncbi:hypothetical protein SCHPADRAFT_484106 [Schizopora paradoxa]|uniref:Uncharacterized protein n=1 Tax=Schizopora paradoxa TaxID=27342 RepID=A0A0H2RH31_9AGAM|nr:hypothetical protein SCHPADRAFT_484106 [Schizopora paradoxa]
MSLRVSKAFAPALHSSGSRGSELHVKDKLRALKERKREKCEILYMREAIEKHSTVVDDHVLNCQAIWNLINSDIQTIATQLGIVTSFANPNLFHKRFSSLPRQYADLRTALQNYVNVLADTEYQRGFNILRFRWTRT